MRRFVGAQLDRNSLVSCGLLLDSNLPLWYAGISGRVRRIRDLDRQAVFPTHLAKIKLPALCQLNGTTITPSSLAIVNGPRRRQSRHTEIHVVILPAYLLRTLWFKACGQ